jgi:O-6-methylguanine DNA methyltransferase
MVLVASDDGLVYVTLPGKQCPLDLSAAEREPSRFYGLSERLISYFAGDSVDFSDRLDFSGWTRFQQEVWLKTREIPRGETRSYAWVAEQIGRHRAVRAVGQALGANPFPIIVPCHRVIASDGGLHGFGGGLTMKESLLRLEGVIATFSA